MELKQFRFTKGVHPKDNKSLTSNSSIQVMPPCTDYYVALSQHIGAPAVCIVEVGDCVIAGQMVASAKGKISANIFSPVFGKIDGIVKRKNNSGIVGDYIHIKADADQSGQPFTFPPLVNPTREDIIKRVEDAGIVGLGGAGFSSAVKISPNKPVDTLIINAAECEPYLNCDNRLILEHTDQVAEGIKLLAQALGVNRVIIGIEDNKIDAYHKFTDYGFAVMLLKTRYPQGAEKVLIYSCTGRRVPNKGGLPMDVGVVVNNVATAYATWDAVANGNPLYKRVLTVSGKGIPNDENLWVLNGTLHHDIFTFCGGIQPDTVKIVSGGPMMGVALADDSGATVKAESGLLCLTAEELGDANTTNCLNCGKCAEVCPMHLMPMYIDLYTLADDTENAVKYGAMDCFECGCCAYICPAKRHLLQSIRLTKKRVREAKK